MELKSLFLISGDSTRSDLGHVARSGRSKRFCGFVNNQRSVGMSFSVTRGVWFETNGGVDGGGGVGVE